MFGCSWLDNRIRKKITSRRKPDPVLVAVVGAAVMGDAEIEGRVSEYESLLVRGQIPPGGLLSVMHTVELIYEVRLNCRHTHAISCDNIDGDVAVTVTSSARCVRACVCAFHS